jgi:hypothetical protein
VEARIPESLVPCILTFVTGKGLRCFFATRLPADDECGAACEHLEVPPGVEAQLGALGARLAWHYFATLRPMIVRGPASREAAAVTQCADEEFGRLVFR